MYPREPRNDVLCGLGCVVCVYTNGKWTCVPQINATRIRSWRNYSQNTGVSPASRSAASGRTKDTVDRSYEKPGRRRGGRGKTGRFPPSDVLIGALISDTLNFLSYAIFGFISLTRSFCRSDKVPAGARGVPRQYSCCSTSNCRRTMRSRARVCETG